MCVSVCLSVCLSVYVCVCSYVCACVCAYTNLNVVIGSTVLAAGPMALHARTSVNVSSGQRLSSLDMLLQRKGGIW